MGDATTSISEHCFSSMIVIRVSGFDFFGSSSVFRRKSSGEHDRVSASCQSTRLSLKPDLLNMSSEYKARWPSRGANLCHENWELHVLNHESCSDILLTDDRSKECKRGDTERESGIEIRDQERNEVYEREQERRGLPRKKVARAVVVGDEVPYARLRSIFNRTEVK